jgi:hypothetical protein
MKKKLLILLPFLLIPWCANSQQTDQTDSGRKCEFSITAAFTYKTYFRNRYLDHPISYSNTGQAHQFDGFTKIPTFGFRTGVLMNKRLYRHVSFVTGLIFTYRKEIYQGNPDTVLKYGSPTSLHLILKYNYSFNDVDLPIMVTYRYKKLIFSAGINIPLISFITARYTYIPTPGDDLEGKKINDFKIFRTLFPTIQVSYTCMVKKFSIDPYLGFEFGTKSSIYLQAGFILPLNNLIRK